MSLFPTRHICCCFLLLGCFFLCAKKTCAQKGAAYILDTTSLPEIGGNYRISFSTSARAVTVSFPPQGGHTFNLRAEYFRTASIPRSIERLHQIKADWVFRSLPLTASYTYNFPGPTSWLSPVAGVGLSAHLYRQTEKLDPFTGKAFQHAAQAPSASISPVFADRRGINFGAEASFGLIMDVTDNIFIMSQGRYRYIACTNNFRYGYQHHALNVLDFSLDIGFQF